MLRFFEPVRGENAYRATQIISDYLRKTGVDGIKYRSFFVSRWV
ncbi:RES domain-containing protein [bacterium C-53]|nr:RES domain-containing protein [Lachnospiraceae bacterium]NBI04966.1 RES domain-containing protein [Lachnospiraceae bacterium]RKJ07537.1 RES domain-containing protein [bacterium C-53]